MPQVLSFLHRAADLDTAHADYAAHFAKALASVRLLRKARAATNRAWTRNAA